MPGFVFATDIALTTWQAEFDRLLCLVNGRPCVASEFLSDTSSVFAFTIWVCSLHLKLFVFPGALAVRLRAGIYFVGG